MLQINIKEEEVEPISPENQAGLELIATFTRIVGVVLAAINVMLGLVLCYFLITIASASRMSSSGSAFFVLMLVMAVWGVLIYLNSNVFSYNKSVNFYIDQPDQDNLEYMLRKEKAIWTTLGLLGIIGIILLLYLRLMLLSKTGRLYNSNY